MDTSMGLRVRGLVLVVACVIAACGSPAPTTTPGPSGSAGTPPSAAASGGHDIAGLPRPAPDAVVATLLGVPDQPLTPDMASLRDEILRQLKDAPTRPVTLPDVKLTSWRSGSGDTPGALPRAVGNDDTLVGFLLVDMAVMGKILPSQQAAGALADMIPRVAGNQGAEGPDQFPEQHPAPESVPFDAQLPSGSHASGTMDTHLSVKAERSLVSVDLDRRLIFNFTAGPGSTTASATTTITIHNTVSVDFCPDVGGVVPLKLATTFTMALPNSTVTAELEGNLLGLVDDNAKHVYNNGSVHVTRLTVRGDRSDDADVQITGLSMDPSGNTSGGRYEAAVGSDQTAGAAAGAALVDLQHAVPIIFDSAERAWRNSSCVAVQLPDFGAVAGGMSDGSGQKDVDPASKTEFTAQVHHRFEHREVNLPIKVTLQAEKSVDPPRLPTTPAKVTYEAPDRPNAHNDVTLEVVSKRGKSKLVMRFDTRDLKLQAKVDGTVVTNANGNEYDAAIHLRPTDLTQGDDGAFHAHATVSWTTTYTPPTAQCKPVTYTGTFETDITVTVDPKDPTSVVFVATFIPGVLKPEILVCSGRNFPFNGGTSLGSWATLAAPHTLVLGQPLKIPSPAAFGTASNTVTITKKPPK